MKTVCALLAALLFASWCSAAIFPATSGLITNYGVAGTASNYVLNFQASGNSADIVRYYVPCLTNAQMVFFVTNAPLNRVGRIEVILDNPTTTNRLVAFPIAWNGLGSSWTTPMTFTNAKVAKLSIQSYGPSLLQSNIIAGWAVRY